MLRIEKTVFIAYNRSNIPWALAINQYLTTHGYDVFYDYHSIDSGEFEEIVFQNIKARAHFIILLSEYSLLGMKNPNDWLNSILKCGLETKRNIIPLMVDGFNIEATANEDLTHEFALLRGYNALRVPGEYFVEAMQRLCERYLNIPLEMVIHPLSKDVSSATKSDEKAQATQKLKVFLCHESQDKPFVRDLYRELSKDGFDAWLDEEKILPGQDWDMEIEIAIEESDAVIICLSSNSVNKDGYVQKEMRYIYEIALEKPEGTIYIIPIRLDDCKIPRRIRHYHSEDFFPDTKTGRAYQRIKKSLSLLNP